MQISFRQSLWCLGAHRQGVTQFGQPKMGIQGQSNGTVAFSIIYLLAVVNPS